MNFEFKFAGLPKGSPFVGSFEGNLAPPPSSAETLRHLVDTISGDEPMRAIFAGMLLRAAQELDAYNEALKLAVGALYLHGHEDDAKKVVAEWKERRDAPSVTGKEE